ncbi:hypothetical protein [Aldersonia kunmingensis]|uniref:DUF7802 domain-containing protein n=1 Tax=Aldersonia kunmingensis TaxID=408066 RepID=UPI00082F1A0A|nr:hypothetical protein [Aldersonia kunmingensis]
MIYVNDITQVGWPLHVLDLVFLLSTITAVVYSVRRYRHGEPRYLVLWLSSLLYGLVLEFTTGMMISRSYIQGDFTFMIHTREVGFATDMPLYIVLLYPTLIFLGFVVIESFGIRSILARAVSAGLIMVLIDAPYVVNGPLAEVGWWEWLDWRVNGRQIFEYWYGWPMSDAYWEMTWPPLLMWLVWHWDKRRRERDALRATGQHGRLRTLLATPLAIAVLVNLGGFVVSSPLGIFIGFGWPQFIIVAITLVIQATVLLFATKSPTGIDRGGWTLLGIHLTGYGVVTIANFWADPIPAGEITIIAVATAALIVLSAYTTIRARAGSASAGHEAVVPQHRDRSPVEPVGSG